jgi:hypothetical protein
VREDASEPRVTVLTTLQCNFAAVHSGHHGDHNKTAAKMSLDTVAQWIERRLDETRTALRRWRRDRS